MLPNQPKSVPIEHRTYFRTVHPADQLDAPRRERRAISAAMTALGDGPPLVSVRIHTDRRDLEVRLTFWELNELSGVLWAAGADLAREMREDEKGVHPMHTLGGDQRVQCASCRRVFHPDALRESHSCPDCEGTLYWVAAAEGDPDGSESDADNIDDAPLCDWVECRDCPVAFHPDSSPHLDRCWECAELVDGVTV